MNQTAKPLGFHNGNGIAMVHFLLDLCGCMIVLDSLRRYCFMRWLCPVLFVVTFSHVRAEIIPADRRIDWTPGAVTGVPGGIPTRTNVYKNIVTDLGADNTGASDVSAIINNAIASCPSGQIIYIPAGTYKVSSAIRSAYKGNFVIRGAGLGQTIIKPATGAIFNFGTSDWPRPSNAIPITAGASKGSNTITLSNTSGFPVPHVFRIEAGSNPTWVHALSSNGGPRLSWTFTCVAKTTNTITFTPALPMDITGMSPQAVAYSAGTISLIGIEDLTVDATGTAATDIFGFQQAWACWLKNVEAINYAHRAVSWGGNVQCEIRHSYFHGGTSTGPGSEGIDLITDNCWNLIEDNIVYNGGGVVLNDAQNACSGNVVAYNFLYNHTAGSGGLADVAVPDFDFGHGTQDTFNLLEGNVLCSIHGGDGFYGGASHNTIFRNWIMATHPIATKNLNCIFLKHYNLYFNVVGNVLGTSAFPTSGSIGNGMAVGGWYEAPQISNYDDGWTSAVQVIYQLGFPNIGNTSFGGTVPVSTPVDYTAESALNSAAQAYDPNVKATLLRHGNYDYVNRSTIWDASIADQAIPDSLSRSGKPNWWPPGVAWPPFGPDKTPMEGTIPARQRQKALTGGSPSSPSGVRVSGAH